MANPNAPRQRGLPQIAQLPTAGALDGTELFETAQNYEPVKVSLAALAAYIGGGGGGGPGGADTQIQYNNAGAFGGITGGTYDGGTFTLDGNLLDIDIVGEFRLSNFANNHWITFSANLTANHNQFFPNAPGTIALCDGAGNLISSPVTFTDGAGVQAGTLLNGPAAGNPTKWIPVDDNGTIRYIPAW
jgi:hypothetical protein